MSLGLQKLRRHVQHLAVFYYAIVVEKASSCRSKHVNICFVARGMTRQDWMQGQQSECQNRCGVLCLNLVKDHAELARRREEVEKVSAGSVVRGRGSHSRCWWHGFVSTCISQSIMSIGMTTPTYRCTLFHNFHSAQKGRQYQHELLQVSASVRWRMLLESIQTDTAHICRLMGLGYLVEAGTKPATWLTQCPH